MAVLTWNRDDPPKTCRTGKASASDSKMFRTGTFSGDRTDLPNRKVWKLSPKSFERYSEVVRKNIVPALGAAILSKLRPMQISDSYARALADGRRDGAGGLSASS